MTPEPHACVVCRREVVWTDCLPAVCYRCRQKEQNTKEAKRMPVPDAVITAERAKPIKPLGY